MIDTGTTVTGLVRQYLVKLSQEESEADRRARVTAKLDRAFDQFKVHASPRTWTRAELYERK